ncbi:MAG: S-methyl-5-thioribose-1-phosphate isomerase [archaeon]
MSDKNIKKIMMDIKSVKIQGARNVAVAGARILMLAAKQSHAVDSVAFVCELKDISRQVAALRPTEPALRYGQDMIISKVGARSALPVKDLKAYAARLYGNYIKETQLALKKIATYGARMISSGDVIMTHCHSNCVIEILRAAKRQGKDFTVVVTETRPLYQGTITARELAKEKIKVVYCIDSCSASMMRKATKVLVGADAITAEGEVVNKIGTFQLAIEAKEFKVPFIVACGTHKYDPRTALGYPEPIEERASREVTGTKKIRGVKVVNPAFDVTPKEYVFEIVTEIGVYSPEILVGILVAGKKG